MDWVHKHVLYHAATVGKRVCAWRVLMFRSLLFLKIFKCLNDTSERVLDYRFYLPGFWSQQSLYHPSVAIPRSPGVFPTGRSLPPGPQGPYTGEAPAHTWSPPWVFPSSPAPSPPPATLKRAEQRAKMQHHPRNEERALGKGIPMSRLL